MAWLGKLHLHYRAREGRTVAHDRHEGPLRVLQPLYPEGPGICHHVLVHPPGGVVGGDELHIDAHLEAGTHALVTTPGATRFYRSDGPWALQHTRLTVDAGARLEWLPLETIAYAGCLAENRLEAQLAPGAQMMGWDVLALGLPAAQQPWTQNPAGRFRQHLQLPQAAPGGWLERALVAADDTRLLSSPLAWANHTVLGTMWLASADPWPTARRDALLQTAREAIEASEAAAPDARAGLLAGASAVQSGVVVLRALAGRVEPLAQLFQRVRMAWRAEAWDLHGDPPRLWRL